MLPDFKSIKTRFREMSNKRMMSLVRSDRLMGQVRMHQQPEGLDCAIRNDEDGNEEGGMKRLEAVMKVDNESLKRHGPLAFIAQMESVAEQFIEQQKSMMLESVSRSSERVGNVVHAKGEPLGPKHVLEMFEKIQIDFDENGQAHMPTLVLNPRQTPFMIAAMHQIEQDPEWRQRFDRLMQLKKEGWIDQENSRKLVD